MQLITGALKNRYPEKMSNLQENICDAAFFSTVAGNPDLN